MDYSLLLAYECTGKPYEENNLSNINESIHKTQDMGKLEAIP